MSMRNGVVVLAFLAVAGLGGCAPASVGRPIPGVVNFASVKESPAVIYRGGQPTPEGYAKLREMKVATVIDLRDDATSWSEEAVTGLGMKYTRIGTNAGRVDKKKIKEFLTTVAGAAAVGPVYVHCRQGRDRTGLEIGMYRILVQGWTREAAIAELHQHGYNKFWFPGIEHFLKTFDAKDFADVRPAVEALAKPPPAAVSARY